MKSVFVIGDLNDKLVSVLDKCVKDKLIINYVNYQKYNEIHKAANQQMQLTNVELSNEAFCDMFISTTKFDELVDEWIILKGDIHTKEFLKILIRMEKSFDPLDNSDLFLSHIAKLTNDDESLSFYLSDAAINTKQMEDKQILGKVIENAQNYILNKKEGISKVDPTINTAIILAANNKNIPGYEVVEWWIDLPIKGFPDSKNIEIKQFDECFDLNAWCIKHKDADAYAFTYPDLLITPDITVGNCIWKSLTILNNWVAEGYVIGGRLKTVLLSRSDSENSYYNSIKRLCD